MGDEAEKGGDATRESLLQRRQGFDVTRLHFYEHSERDPAVTEVFCYTDRLSYAPGETVSMHGSSTAAVADFMIVRDGARRAVAATFPNTAMTSALVPDDFVAAGCGWPIVASWTIPRDTPPGFFVIRASATGRDGIRRESEHGFFVRRAPDAPRAPILLLAATCTWVAYNDWGGVNSYYAARTPPGQPANIPFGARLSLHRPWARGFMALPVGAPRKPHDPGLPMHALRRYPPIEFAYARGFSKWYSNAGWATYERPFVIWAEQSGYSFDYATQHDLDADPNLLAGYACVVMVGHDEYWSWQMRDAIDAYVDGGGRFAHFGANFAWQVRLEEGGAVQVCYKDRAEQHDPRRHSTPDRTTTTWDSPVTGRPGAQTMGLTCSYGVYAGVGGQAARGAAGFTVYRPDHWAFADTDLGYGDVFGGDARIFGYEVDGLDYVVRDGLPYPTHRDGAPETTQILAMGLASNTEAMGTAGGSVSYYGDSAPFLAQLRYGRTDAEAIDAASRGSGMIVHFTRGAGEVFNAGSAEWVAGLQARDPFTEIITRNVLDRYARPPSA